MKILDTAIDFGPDIYYSEPFQNMILDHLPYLQSHPDVETITVETETAYIYEGDFYGLLHYKAIPAYMHWITMVVNNLDSSLDYREDMVSIKYVRQSVIEELRLRFVQ